MSAAVPRPLALLLASALGMVLGLSCGGSAAPIDLSEVCRSCKALGRLCFWTPECPSDDCTSATSVKCVNACSVEGVNCAEGYPCLDHDGRMECSPSCVNTSCTRAREECVGGSCQSVACGDVVPCLGDGLFCFQHDCFATNGDCTARSVCPKYALGSAQCLDGYCQIAVRAPDVVYTYPEAPLVDVQQPSSGYVFPEGSDPLFTWAPLPEGVIALILKKPQTLQGDLLAAAVWGKTAPAFTEPAFHWSEGEIISEGSWTGATPGAPPVGVPLYFYLQEVARGELIAHSVLVPFAYGEPPWAVPGSSCDPADENACPNPTRVLTCSSSATCAAICASERDCQDQGLSCGAVDRGVRACQ